MPFSWRCPYCNNLYTYNGGQTKRADGKCNNKECLSYRVSVKIWQYRQIEKKIISTPKTPKIGVQKIDYNKIPEKVVKYAKDISFESDDIRYFLKKIKGKTFRGNDADAYDELLFYLHQYRPKFIANWDKRKRGQR